MPKRTYTLHLIKPDITDFNEVLSESAQDKLAKRLTQVVDDANFAGGARLYIFASEEYPATWLTDLARHFEVKTFNTNSSCGVLCFKSANRMFAITFAHGWMYLNEIMLKGISAFGSH